MPTSHDRRAVTLRVLAPTLQHRVMHEWGSARPIVLYATDGVCYCLFKINASHSVSVSQR